MESYAFSDIFVVQELIKEDLSRGNVTHIEAKSESYDMFMKLEVNTDESCFLFPHRFVLSLGRNLNSDGTADTGYSIQEKEKKSPAVADIFESVIKGKLYRISEEIEETSNEIEGTSSSNISVTKVVKRDTCSFGGQYLMMLKGNPSYMPKFELDDQLLLFLNDLDGVEHS